MSILPDSHAHCVELIYAAAHTACLHLDMKAQTHVVELFVSLEVRGMQPVVPLASSISSYCVCDPLEAVVVTAAASTVHFDFGHAECRLYDRLPFRAYMYTHDRRI